MGVEAEERTQAGVRRYFAYHDQSWFKKDRNLQRPKALFMTALGSHGSLDGTFADLFGGPKTNAESFL